MKTTKTMTGPMCHHDVNAPDLACVGCARWHSDPAYRARIRSLPADTASAVRAARMPTPLPAPVAPATLPRVVPKDGPGTELKVLFEVAEIDKIFPGCIACARMIDQMNEWGVEGCRKNLDKIADHLRAAAEAVGWLPRLRAAKGLVRRGIVLNPINPYPGLVKEAIRRWVAKEGSGAAPNDRGA